ncbi:MULTISPECIES: NAD(P)-dependent oxidoreductase [Amycolatopsis]|uniref:NAD(P)-binding domain-containing protein n=1 Tax=Amycolatopsis thermalba TaxID=944492 RepID=A0ABY4NR79_9PSEU|nr:MULTISPECIES: NAD(P)-binding domain-containing protein [Amycolatopsis]OXM68191.1 oxidoreductase [Amycolatopsis sp. KNN50.9b]UQS22592.1 NAD(P)-binding domain-containing protein [Amycolatopsis thermalba]
MNTTTGEITVLGLGEMGSAIARVFLDRGYRTTVWNRTASKAAPLVEAGATTAPTAAEAVAASQLVVVCLLDGTAVDEVLSTLGDTAQGKVLVNVTSGSPDQARAYERWAHEHGAQYIDGKIMGDPPYVGTPNARFLFSGSAFEAHRDALNLLGAVSYHGDDAGAAAVEFLAQVAMGYEVLLGFLHTLKLVRSEGADVTGFADRFAASLTAYQPLLTSIAKAVESREYPPDLGPLDVQFALMDDLIGHRESVGVEAVRMRETRELMARRIADGHGGEGFSGVYELLAGAPNQRAR